MTTYFSNCQTLDELKKEYRRLAFANHPDHGGDTEIMKAINNEYETCFNRLKYGSNENKSHSTNCQQETAADFIFIINELLKLDGLDIELCGRWLWISGNTFQHKARLKEIGCVWCSKKKLWSWHFPEDSKISTKNTPMEKIRQKYGSTVINKAKQYCPSVC